MSLFDLPADVLRYAFAAFLSAEERFALAFVSKGTAALAKLCAKRTTQAKLIEAASAGGHLKLLQWMLMRLGFRFYCIFWPLRHAAEHCRLNVLRWLVQCECPGSVDYCNCKQDDEMRITEYYTEIAEGGIYGDHVEVLLWLKTECRYAYDDARVAAARNGALTVLDYLVEEKRLPRGADDAGYLRCFDELAKRAVENDHASVLQWLVDRYGWGCFDPDRIERAALNRRAEKILRWFNQKTEEGAPFIEPVSD